MIVAIGSSGMTVEFSSQHAKDRFEGVEIAGAYVDE